MANQRLRNRKKQKKKKKFSVDIAFLFISLGVRYMVAVVRSYEIQLDVFAITAHCLVHSQHGTVLRGEVE